MARYSGVRRHAASDLRPDEVGPTSANLTPARIVFVRSRAAKERLLPALAAGNVEKVKAAPVTAIVACDLLFYEQQPTLTVASAAAAIVLRRGVLPSLTIDAV